MKNFKQKLNKLITNEYFYDLILLKENILLKIL